MSIKFRSSIFSLSSSSWVASSAASHYSSSSVWHSCVSATAYIRKLPSSSLSSFSGVVSKASFLSCCFSSSVSVFGSSYLLLVHLLFPKDTRTGFPNRLLLLLLRAKKELPEVLVKQLRIKGPCTNLPSDWIIFICLHNTRTTIIIKFPHKDVSILLLHFMQNLACVGFFFDTRNR